MFGFLKGRLGRPVQEIAGDDFVIAVGAWAMRGRGSVKVLLSDQGFDLELGPATLTKLNGTVWSTSPLDLSAGLNGEALFEGRRFAVRTGPFSIVELPGEPWFGLALELREHRSEPGPCVLSRVKLQLGITKDKRFKASLSEATFVAGLADFSEPNEEGESGLEVVDRRSLPADHGAIAIGPDLYAVLYDAAPAKIRTSFERAEYEERLRQWQSRPVVVIDEERVSAVSPAVRRLSVAAESRSLLLLPWLPAQLAQRCHGEPVLQLFDGVLVWIDSDEEDWQETMEEEVVRCREFELEALGPPLVYRAGRWLNAVTALKSS